MFRYPIVLLILIFSTGGAYAGNDDEIERHSGHVQWSTSRDGSKSLIIAGPAAERAFNDPRAELYGEDAEKIKKHFGPLDCWYIKNGVPLNEFQRFGAFITGWSDSDLHYFCWVTGLP